MLFKIGMLLFLSWVFVCCPGRFFALVKKLCLHDSVRHRREAVGSSRRHVERAWVARRVARAAQTLRKNLRGAYVAAGLHLLAHYPYLRDHSRYFGTNWAMRHRAVCALSALVWQWHGGLRPCLYKPPHASFHGKRYPVH